MTAVEAILAILISLHPYKLDKENGEQREERLTYIAQVIAEESNSKKDMAWLLALGTNESRWAEYVGKGCTDGPKGSCDAGNSRGYWQSWTGTCKEFDKTPRGSREAVRAQAKCAVRLGRYFASRCGSAGHNPIEGAFSRWAGRNCGNYKDAKKRRRMFQRFLERIYSLTARKVSVAPKSYHLFDHLRLNGTGTYEQASDYSVTPGRFWVEYAEPVVINRMIGSYEDNQSIAASEYGAGPALTNGIKISIEDANDDEIVDLIEGRTVKTNADWTSFCYDASPIDYGTGANYMAIRWTFGRTGMPLILEAGWKLIMTISDDLSGLTSHTFQAQGFYPHRIPPESRFLFPSLL